MKKFDVILEAKKTKKKGNLYNDNKDFAKLYDTWLNTMSKISRLLKKEGINNNEFNSLFEDIEQFFNKITDG